MDLFVATLTSDKAKRACTVSIKIVDWLAIVGRLVVHITNNVNC